MSGGNLIEPRSVYIDKEFSDVIETRGKKKSVELKDFNFIRFSFPLRRRKCSQNYVNNTINAKLKERNKQ